MNTYVILQKKDFDLFITRLTNLKKVVAPVAKGFNNFSFEEVKEGQQISLNHIPTILPPKKYFLPKREQISEYNKSNSRWNPKLEFKDLTVLGVHTCDLAGIQCLNLAMTRKPKDTNYIVRKNKITIIGFECNQYCDKFASCAVMKNHLPKGGYDLFFTELDKSYLVHINTMEGNELITGTGIFSDATSNDLNKLEAIRESKRNVFQDEVNVEHHDLKGLLDHSFESRVWDDLEERCLSCGNCTNVCPTCYCFDVKDDINLDFNTGSIWRTWDSCQNEDFAKVSGGETFRKERGLRQRHRYMRKFNYPVKKFQRYFCTGCGRCSRSCMAKINLKETINALERRE